MTRALLILGAFAGAWWLATGGWMRVLWAFPEPVHNVLYDLTGHAVTYHRDCCGRHGAWLSWEDPKIWPGWAADDPVS